MDKDKVVAFIDNIPDTKLIGFSEEGCTIWSDEDFRIDMQGVSPLQRGRERSCYCSFLADLSPSSRSC